MTGTDHDVIIIGGGPTGLMLAGELALGGVDVAIVERRPDQTVAGSRAGGLHSRALELFDQRGIADSFIAQGTKHYSVAMAGIILDARDRPSRFNYTLGLWQQQIEQGLAEWALNRDVRFYRQCEFVHCDATDAYVDVRLADSRALRCSYLVGCDGGRSMVRKLAGIGFQGSEPQASYLIFEGTLPGEPPLGIRYGNRGLYALGRLADGRVRGIVTEARLEHGDQPDLEDLRATLEMAYGSDLGVREVTWMSRFTDAARQAEAYRKGRILLAGDAAHVHSPVGGQGLNVGLQDAVNLGWKLAQVIRGVSQDSLLVSYQDEQHPVGAALLDLTRALTALNRGDDHTAALRSFVATTMALDEPRKSYAARVSGLDIRYGPEGPNPLLGRRMPDLDVETDHGPTRIFELLHDARPLLLNFADPTCAIPARWNQRIKTLDVATKNQCELAGIGFIELPPVVLIRPDGHVAWVGDEARDGLAETLSTWFGD